MKLRKLVHYATKINRYGLIKIVEQIYLRSKKLYFIKLYKKKALLKQASINWKHIEKENKYTKTFEHFLKDLKNKKFLETIYSYSIFQNSIPKEFHSKKWILEKANDFSKNCFEILGSNKTCFEFGKIPWQNDIKIKKGQNCHYATSADLNAKNKLFFYSDILIKPALECNLTDYLFDIKIPWELSRFNHVFILGKAYSKMKNPKFALAFKNQIEDWIDNNPFLLGINWLCPMDVAIRSINWIWGFYFFKRSELIGNNFWEKFVCSLYDHAKYLEYNLEKTLKPHNHYLSDLIGYLYISIFLEDLKVFRKAQIKCKKELLVEFERQIHKDGTSYEGSSSYHKLVTEIFAHFNLLNMYKDNKIKLNNKLEKMYQFIIDSTDSKNNHLQIGDNDSGKILCGLRTDKNIFNYKINNGDVINYKNFGISIIKNQNWHFSIRHASFNQKQPSGHFHNDIGSITLSLKGQPILIDPGSYLYTANPKIRNYFRSALNHNRVCAINNYEFDNQLFELKSAKKECEFKINKYKNSTKIISENLEYLSCGFSLIRTINFERQNDSLEIEDLYEPKNDFQINNNQKLVSTLIFHPSINIKTKNLNEFLIFHSNKILAKIKTSLEFRSQEGLYSPSYGKKLPCNKLVADFNKEKVSKIKIELLDKS